MKRRDVLAGVVMAMTPFARARAQTPSAFEDALAAFTADPDLAEAASAYRERFQRSPGDPSGAQASAWDRSSARSISARARNLIVACEVSSRSLYERRYQRPVWPGGQSGVTIGIGYDLGYATPTSLRASWNGKVDAGTIAQLETACQVVGEEARHRTAALSGVIVPWTAADAQFSEYLPYAIGKTEDTFPNTDALSDDSLGALVSLVYNRGASLAPTGRRREMREIHRLMQDRDFAAVPEKIREMKRLWLHDPGAAGLLARRDLEALLFEEGIGPQ